MIKRKRELRPVSAQERRNRMKDLADDLRLISRYVDYNARHASEGEMERYWDTKTIWLIRKITGLLKYHLGL